MIEPVPSPIERLVGFGVLPVVEVRRLESAVPLAKALRDVGLACLEIAFRTEHAAAAIERVRREVPEMVVAAGTILTVDDAAAAIHAGADLVISPGSSGRVINYVRRQGVNMVPGVMTPSEIEQNLELGLTLLKLFPAEQAGGAAYLRTLAGPYPNVTFVPTGGIRPSSLPAYLAVPSVAFCAGTWIAPAAAIEAGDLGSVARMAREAIALVAHARTIVGPSTGHVGRGETDRGVAADA